MIDIDCMNNKTDEDLAPGSQHSHISYREILEKFCKVFGLSLCLKQDPETEMWICKTASVNLDCTIFGKEPSIKIWSRYCRTAEEACKDYIETMLGCYLAAELVPVFLSSGSVPEMAVRANFISIPKTLEEFMIWIDLQQNATAVSSS